MLLLYTLARLKNDRHTRGQVEGDGRDREPLLRSYGPWGSGAQFSYPYDRLVSDRLWQLPDRVDLFDAGAITREGVARERDAPAGSTPDVLATFEREPELIDELMSELNSFKVDFTSAGNMRVDARSKDHHGDLVIATALALWSAVGRPSGRIEVGQLENYW